MRYLQAYRLAGRVLLGALGDVVDHVVDVGNVVIVEGLKRKVPDGVLQLCLRVLLQHVLGHHLLGAVSSDAVVLGKDLHPDVEAGPGWVVPANG